MLARSRSRKEEADSKEAEGSQGDADGSEMMYESDCDQRLVPLLLNFGERKRCIHSVKVSCI